MSDHTFLHWPAAIKQSVSIHKDKASKAGLALNNYRSCVSNYPWQVEWPHFIIGHLLFMPMDLEERLDKIKYCDMLRNLKIWPKIENVTYTRSLIKLTPINLRAKVFPKAKIVWLDSRKVFQIEGVAYTRGFSLQEIDRIAVWGP